MPLFDRILEHYFGGEPAVIEAGQSGWNNTTRFVTASGTRWVLRIYETHRDASKILFEHEALLALSEQGLPFHVPIPKRTLHGNTIVRLEDGTDRLACLFSYSEGRRPDESDLSIAYQIGEASARLLGALQNISLTSKPAYRPYYEIESAYPLCPPDQVTAFCARPPEPFRSESQALGVIGSAMRTVTESLHAFRLLPHQLIHGDINHSNLLVDTGKGERIAAILDFEFCTRDLRAMEPAVILSGFVKGGDSLGAAERFLQGFGSVQRMTRPEAAAIPVLIRLRKLDVFIHFLSRYRDGVDGADVLKEQIDSVSQGLRVMESFSDRLTEACVRFLT
ncbi:phosphotransferase [Cohnella sp. CFH 77786]|uniref:phosphotransferase n=1 Tax=Cohnella sp. CFH 77786 TaxID=2662265 RepID=UPI001C608994|nr:phosphotransferase [Cohnella sp. CFH 77786]MBW5444894.1 phosphotransferase [Cohnella sp. CFH 77786]